MVKSQNICYKCDCTISEEYSDVRAVRKVQPVCNEGSFKWYNVYGGALRINFKPIFRGDFLLCFILNAENVRVQISQELPNESTYSVNYERPAGLKRLLAADGRTNETCLMSSDESIRLFLEPERTVESTGFSFVDIQFIMERNNAELVYNTKEECRPCTDEELVEAYCSHSDVVIVGSMTDVKHVQDQTHIYIQISKVIRNRQLLIEGHRRRIGPYIEETMVRHRQCGVEHGSGLFLFTGKWRLGQLTLTCSPYYSDWTLVSKRAVLEGKIDYTNVC
ncbi:meteorin-like protein [Mytilus californianus]|uniref:meteorin-like protein n=1 Tax=Mytilus californianus TaxID=6549 RepID=UPI0022483E0F|nr:meteorin-like protein [Mytilus californianus]